jgi:hypothetical protein
LVFRKRLVSGIVNFLDKLLAKVKDWLSKFLQAFNENPIVGTAIVQALGALHAMTSASSKLGGLGFPHVDFWFGR